MKLIFIIPIIIVAILLIVGVIFFIRRRKFKPTTDKQAQKNQLNNDLETTGFAYDSGGDYFYSLMNCWQRKAGYCSLYNEGAPLFNMIMDCEPITFSYGGKRWLIEMWKGQYGITTGGEVGIYNTICDDIQSDNFTGTFYEAISDDERLKMSFVLRRNNRVILKRKALHWWLTGFKLGEFSSKDSLTMQVQIQFPNREMLLAFTDALIRTGYSTKEFHVRGRAVNISFTEPHSIQPPTQEGIQEAVVQQVNKNNCVLYKVLTSRYSDTLDKLEYLKASAPEVYEFMLHSLYAKGFFAAFEWLIELVHPPCTPIEPEPPEPTPPDCPCPPCPPTPPECCSPCPPECRYTTTNDRPENRYNVNRSGE